MNKVFVFIVIYLIAYPAHALFAWQHPQTMITVDQHAYQWQQQQTQLSTLQKKIRQLKQALSGEKNRQKSLVNKLKQTELAISQQLNQQHQIKNRLQQQQQLQQKLEQQQQQLQTTANEQQQQLTQQLHLAYLIDDPSFVRLLLSRQTLQDHNRMITYLRHVHNEQQQHLQQLNTTIQQLTDNQQKLQQVIETIKDTQIQQQQQYQKLRQEKQKRQQLLTKMNQDIAQQQSQLSSLQADQKNLEKIIKDLQRKKSLQSLAFGQLKGKLPMPVTGHVIEHFGAKIGSAQFNLKGILIAAPIGQEVRTVYPGKVIFADWLKGFGLLMIIDHGDGFMTLYGRNQSLFKNLGDIIKPNEVIAEVGQSGGHKKNGLYFEIRHNGHPINPELWCKST